MLVPIGRERPNVTGLQRHSAAMGAGRARPIAAAWGVAGGLVLGALLFGTYLGAVFMIVPAIVGGYGVARRQPGATTTWWLAAQGCGAIVLQAALVSKW